MVRRHADTQRRLCQRFAAPVIAAVTCQDITPGHMQQIVSAAPTASEGDRLHRCLSAMVTAGIKGGYLTSPRLREVHWPIPADGRWTRIGLRRIKTCPAGRGSQLRAKSV